MDMSKSSRHSKLTGDFGESLVVYLLSKYGFECNRFDHTGIDVIATHPVTRQRMGISVKSRSRYSGTTNGDLGVSEANFQKAASACEAFGLVPYFAYVIDCPERIYVFITTMDQALRIAPLGNELSRWRMTPEAIQKYEADPAVMIMQFDMNPEKRRWWPITSPEQAEEPIVAAPAPQSEKATPPAPTSEVQSDDDLVLAIRKVANSAIREYFESQLLAGREYRTGHPYLIYSVAKRKRWYVGPRKRYAYVWQKGHFPDDENFWQEKLGEEIDLSPTKDGLTFCLYTAEQAQRFDLLCYELAGSNPFS